MGLQLIWCTCKNPTPKLSEKIALPICFFSHTQGGKRALLTQVGPSLSSTLRNPDQHFEGPPGVSRCDFLVWSVDCFLLNWKHICYVSLLVCSSVLGQPAGSVPRDGSRGLVSWRQSWSPLHFRFARTRYSKDSFRKAVFKIMSFPDNRPFWKGFLLHSMCWNRGVRSQRLLKWCCDRFVLGGHSSCTHSCRGREQLTFFPTAEVSDI